MNVIEPVLLVAVVAHLGLLVHLYRRFAARALARASVPTAWVAVGRGALAAPRARPGELVLRLQAAIGALAITSVIFMATCAATILGTLVVGAVRGS